MPSVEPPFLPEQVLDHAEKMKPLLAGLPQEVQAAILAELVATWLAGNLVPERPDDPTVDQLRHMMFDQWAASVWALVEVSEAELRERYGMPRSNSPKPWERVS